MHHAVIYIGNVFESVACREKVKKHGFYLGTSEPGLPGTLARNIPYIIYHISYIISVFFEKFLGP